MRVAPSRRLKALLSGPVVRQLLRERLLMDFFSFNIQGEEGATRDQAPRDEIVRLASEFISGKWTAWFDFSLLRFSWALDIH